MLLHQLFCSIVLSRKLVTVDRLLVIRMLRTHYRAVSRHCRILGELLLNIIMKGMTSFT